MVGARWGDGVLKLSDGEEKSFSLYGAKMLETGVSASDFTGEVYNLKNVADFERGFVLWRQQQADGTVRRG